MLSQGLIVVIEHYFQIWNKKEYIIISRGIRSPMAPIFIETPSILPTDLIQMETLVV